MKFFLYLKSARVYCGIALILASAVPALAGFTPDPPPQQRSWTDHTGRLVTVADNPQRIIALAPNITEIIFALGRGDRLKGVVSHSNYPPQALDLPQVGDYVRLDIEKIVALKPDLCIAVQDGNPKATVLRLAGFGIPVYAVNPRSLETMLACVTDIGAVIGAPEQGRALAAALRGRIQRVAKMTAAAQNRPRLFFQIGVSPIVSAGSDTFLNELIEKAGARNLAANQTGYPKYAFEEVVAMSPEIIVITTMEGAAVEGLLDRWREWPKVPAVRDNRLYIVDSDMFDRPSPRLIDALERLARMVHPDLPWDLPDRERP